MELTYNLLVPRIRLARVHGRLSVLKSFLSLIAVRFAKDYFQYSNPLMVWSMYMRGVISSDFSLFTGIATPDWRKLLHSRVALERHVFYAKQRESGLSLPLERDSRRRLPCEVLGEGFAVLP